MLKIALIVVVVLALAFGVLYFVRQSNVAEKKDGRMPFYKKRPLTPVEVVLFNHLRRALPDCMILAQVQLSRFLDVESGENKLAWLNRVNRMSVDFLICDEKSNIIAVIELDDKLHRRADRRKANEKKNRAILSAGLHLIRWPVGKVPSIASIRATVLSGVKPVKAA